MLQLGQLVRDGIAYARSTHGATGPAVRLDLHALLDSVVCDYQDAGKPVTLGECARFVEHAAADLAAHRREPDRQRGEVRR
jgi:hypothetical protein